MLGFQVHHIFPEAMMGNFEKTFKDMGININANDYSNRINLFNNDEMANVMKEFHTKNPDDMNAARFFGSVRHSGGHETYNSFVKDALTDILNQKIDSNIKKAMVLDLHQQLVIAMREGSISLYNDNLTTEQTLQNYDKVFATRLAKPQDFMDSDGNYNPNTARSKQVESYKLDYDRFNVVNLDNNKSIIQDFDVIKQLLIEKYGSLDNLPNPPYLEQTKNELKLGQDSKDLNKLRDFVATLVYDEAKASSFIITKEDIKLFNETDDENIKANIANIIKNAPNKNDVDAETIIKAQSYANLYETIHQVATVTSKFVEIESASEDVKQQLTHFRNGQGGYVTPEFLEFIFPVKKIHNSLEDFARKMMEDSKLSAKFNGMAGMMDFVNNVYDGLIEGLTTNNWDKFFEQAKEHGTEAVIGTAVGVMAIAAFGAMAAAGGVVAVVGTAGATLLVGAGLAAWGYMWYELTTKIRETDWDTVIDGFMSNILKIDELKDWLNEQSTDVIDGLADILTQFDKWGEKNALADLLRDYKEVLSEKENSKEAFKYLKQQYDANTKFMGTEKDDELINTTKEGDHILYGGQGNDTLIGNDKMDILIGGEGDDTLDGKEGNDILGGNDGNDTLNGGKGNDYLHGGEGDDTLDGGTGRDVLIGGIGKDNYEFLENFGHDTIDDRDGQGVIRIDNQILQAGERITGDRWYSSDKSYIISASKVHESDTTYVLLVQAVGDNSKSITIKDWRQNDLGLTLAGLGQPQEQPAINEWTVGNAHNNIITRKQYMNALDGNDWVFGTANDDVVLTGAGRDLIVLGDGNDIIYSGVKEGVNDDDLIFAGEGEDVIHSGAGDDVIFSSSVMYWSNNGLSQTIKDMGEDNRNIPQEQKRYSNQIGWDISYDKAIEFPSNDAYYYADTHYHLPIIKAYYVATAKDNKKLYLFNNIRAITNDGYGYQGADLVYAGAGNDMVVGSSDGDILYGEQGKDTLFGLDGHDVLYGGEGHDALYGGDGLDLLIGGDDDDHLVGGVDDDKLYGGSGDDHIQGDLAHLRTTNLLPESAPRDRFGNDYLDGGEGDDVMVGSIGNDKLYGGTGNDELVGDASYIEGEWHGQDYLDGGEGDDKLWGLGGDDTLYGGDGNDGLSGDYTSLDGQYHGSDYLDGGKGKDNLWGHGGGDTLYGGEGDDELSGDNVNLDGQYHGDDYLDGGEGNDKLWGDGGNDILYGGNGNGDDELMGDNNQLEGKWHGQDYLDGGEGDDKLWGYGDNDTLYGGEGDDKLSGDNVNLDGQYHGDDYLDGGEGDDKLWGHGGDDKLYGGDGNDGLSGDHISLDGQYHGSDYLDGGKGKDNLWGHGSNDTLYGGEGDDELSGDNVNLDGQYHGDDYLDGGEGNDKLWGDGGNDTLYGGNGNDELAGDDNQLEGKWHGQDYLDGGEGDDKLWGNGGNDTLYGGNGNDELAGDNMHLAGEWHGQDRLEGGEGDDRLWGYGGNDTLYGGSGDDYLEGDYHDMNEQYHGDDMIDGGSGNDILIGLGGNDTLYGGSGDDILDGDSGDDIMIGGAGNDTYYVDSLSDTIIESDDEGLDIVYASIDYTLDDGNHIDVLKLTGMALVGIGNNLDNSIVGNQFDNILEGGGGNDFLIATQGADILDGGIGDDIYHFDTKALNDGLTKTIKDSDLTGVIRINGQDLTGQNLRLIGYNATTQEYTWVNEQGYQIRKDSQGYTISSDDFNSHILIATDSQAGNILGLDIALPPKPLNPIEAKNYLTLGTLGDDIITVNDDKAHSINGFMGDDIIYGGSQNDILNGEIGNDVIFGGQGNDKLYGGLGSDVLNGGQGDDYLDGSYGNDTYVFKLGDGQDIIKDISGSDTLDLSDFLSDDLIVAKQSGNLIIKFKSDTTEQNSITIQNWDNPAYQIEKIVLADTIINNIQLTNIIG